MEHTTPETSRKERITQFPFHFEVSAIVSSRYYDNERPASWDRRIEGVDVVRAVDGTEYTLWSQGDQSPPKPGWVVMVTSGDEEGYRWTLFGMRPAHRSH